MGRARHLCYALNATRRRWEEGIEERRPGINPLIGRGIRPIVLRFNHGKGSWEKIIMVIMLDGEVGHSLHPNH